MPEEDFHLFDQARFQAHVGTRCRASAIENPSWIRRHGSLPKRSVWPIELLDTFCLLTSNP